MSILRYRKTGELVRPNNELNNEPNNELNNEPNNESNGLPSIVTDKVDITPNILDQPSAAILIDCWEDSEATMVYDNIINFLYSTPQIKLVVLASYETTDIMTDGLIKKSVWHTNYFKKHGKRRTDKRILTYIDRSKFQITVLTLADFTQLMEQYPEIKNLYFMGTSWIECVQHRPLGIEHVSSVFDVNILVNQKCVFHHLAPPNPDLSVDNNYQRIYNDVFILKKR